MTRLTPIFGFLALWIVPSAAFACDTGLYRTDHSSAPVVLTRSADVLRYTFIDGRRGEAVDGGIVSCVDGRPWLEDGPHRAELRPMALKQTPSQFESHGTTLSGSLVELPNLPLDAPLVVLVHGSERSSPIAGANPYIFAAHGLRVFAYDKRGTGASEGVYTQNFELLADDAAAAFAEARRIARGRHGRIGYYGGSQGGWVAPLAATRSSPDFVAVGFGLAISPLEEDREQVLDELRSGGADDDRLAAGRRVADAVAALVQSNFEQGYEALREVRQRYGDEAWFTQIRGEFTGGILAMSEADLRRVGRARFDNLELIWDYDGIATLRELEVPLLWVVAEADREAPPEVTMARLEALRGEGASIDVFSFADTDHGMVEFEQIEGGKRTYGRITDGYFRLVADWIKGETSGDYGRARRR